VNASREPLQHKEKAGNEETLYEKNQRFNALVAWLHSFRYKNITAVFTELARQKQESPIKVVEIGCAHAKLFSILKDKFIIDYTGIEVDDSFVNAARLRYAKNKNFRVLHSPVEEVLSDLQNADIIVALETLEHIPEHAVVRIVEAVAAASPRLFVCSVPVEIGPAIWLKNLGSLLTGYIRHEEYRWMETFWAGLYQLDRLPPHGTGHKGFDWRWLAQTIRHNMKILELRKLPVPFLPAAFAFTVFIVATPTELVQGQ
jgi:Methyltransferase domain